MANPQAENGHIDIAHEIAEALARINLSKYESRILWALFRKTYGWHKKEDRISITQFQKMTGLKRRHVQRTLTTLIQRNLVTSKGYSFVTTYGFQKDYTKWQTVTCRGNKSAKKQTVTCRGYPLAPVEVTILAPVEVTTKEKKETIQKKENEPCAGEPRAPLSLSTKEESQIQSQGEFLYSKGNQNFFMRPNGTVEILSIGEAKPNAG